LVYYSVTGFTYNNSGSDKIDLKVGDLIDRIYWEYRKINSRK